jgi:hypothetical protein
MPPRPSKLDPFKPIIDEILRSDLDAPRKERHTVKRIYDRLIDERDMRDVSYQVVRAYVADRKPKIRVDAGRGPIPGAGLHPIEGAGHHPWRERPSELETVLRALIRRAAPAADAAAAPAEGRAPAPGRASPGPATDRSDPAAG